MEKTQHVESFPYGKDSTCFSMFIEDADVVFVPAQVNISVSSMRSTHTAKPLNALNSEAVE